MNLKKKMDSPRDKVEYWIYFKPIISEHCILFASAARYMKDTFNIIFNYLNITHSTLS